MNISQLFGNNTTYYENKENIYNKLNNTIISGKENEINNFITQELITCKENIRELCIFIRIILQVQNHNSGYYSPLDIAFSKLSTHHIKNIALHMPGSDVFNIGLALGESKYACELFLHLPEEELCQICTVQPKQLDKLRFYLIGNRYINEIQEKGLPRERAISILQNMHCNQQLIMLTIAQKKNDQELALFVLENTTDHYKIFQKIGQNREREFLIFILAHITTSTCYTTLRTMCRQHDHVLVAWIFNNTHTDTLYKLLEHAVNNKHTKFIRFIFQITQKPIAYTLLEDLLIQKNTACFRFILNALDLTTQLKLYDVSIKKHDKFFCRVFLENIPADTCYALITIAAEENDTELAQLLLKNIGFENISAILQKAIEERKNVYISFIIKNTDSLLYNKFLDYIKDQQNIPYFPQTILHTSGKEIFYQQLLIAWEQHNSQLDKFLIENVNQEFCRLTLEHAANHNPPAALYMKYLIITYRSNELALVMLQSLPEKLDRQTFEHVVFALLARDHLDRTLVRELNTRIHHTHIRRELLSYTLKTDSSSYLSRLLIQTCESTEITDEILYLSLQCKDTIENTSPDFSYEKISEIAARKTEPDRITIHHILIAIYNDSSLLTLQTLVQKTNLQEAPVAIFMACIENYPLSNENRHPCCEYIINTYKRLPISDPHTITQKFLEDVLFQGYDLEFITKIIDHLNTITITQSILTSLSPDRFKQTGGLYSKHESSEIMNSLVSKQLPEHRQLETHAENIKKTSQKKDAFYTMTQLRNELSLIEDDEESEDSSE